MEYLKAFKFLLSIGLALSVILSVNMPKADAAKCVRTHLGLQCNNNVHAVKNVSVYYTKSQVKKIVSRYNNLGSNKSLIIGYIASLRSPQIGLGTLMYQVGANNMIKPFKTAKSKGTGLQISYKVTIYKGSNALTKVSNVKYKYK